MAASAVCKKVFVGMGIDAQHAEVARHRRLRAERLRLDGAGFPKHFRCLGARDVPVDRQAVIVRHLDLVGVASAAAPSSA